MDSHCVGLTLPGIIEEELDDDEAVFICQLCYSLCGVQRTDKENLYDAAGNVQCRTCTGELFLNWLSNTCGKSVSFNESDVVFNDTSTGQIYRISKTNLTPHEIWKRITGPHN